MQADAEDISLAEVIARYYSQHAASLPSAGRARVALELWLEFFGEAAVADLHEAKRQEEFQAWLRARNQAAGSIKRILGVGRAAINRAWKRGEVRAVPFIQMVEVKDAPPKGRPLEIDEIVRLLDVAPPHLRDFIFWMVGTGGRPDAILDLGWPQIDTQRRIIQLNPPGRPQTKKYRPTVRLPVNLLELVSAQSNLADRVIIFDGKGVASIRSSWRKARRETELDEQVQPYSLRHTVARWLRSQSVPVWEVAAQLGHSMQNYSMTERYAPYDPAYLRASTAAIDAFLAELRCRCVSVAKIENQLSH